MKAWIYAGPAHRPNLAAMIDLAHLWQAGVLTDDSTVWIDITAETPAMWALTGDQSSRIHVHRCNNPGYVRVTSDRIRWAPTYDGSNTAPHLDLNLAEIPGDHFTLVVAHRATDDSRIGLIQRSRRDTIPPTGKYTTDGLTIVDLATYQPAAATPPSEAATRIALANANYYGPRLLSSAMHEGDSSFFRDHPDAFAFDLDTATMDLLCQHIAVITQYADQFRPAFAQRLQDALTASAGHPT